MNNKYIFIEYLSFAIIVILRLAAILFFHTFAQTIIC